MTLLLLSLLACKGDPPTPPVVETGPPSSCDAGDEAWVQRAIPLMWGRKPRGSAEVRAWSAMVAQQGRESVIQAMAEDPEFASWWRQWITDALAVARTGDKAYSSCFMSPRRDTHDGSLTQRIRSVSEPWSAATPPGGAFNMADVILDAIEADDLAVAWQVNLYSRMNRPVQGANVSIEELEFNRRTNFGESFFETYLNRDLDCVLCHNSQFSTTDDEDARYDRTWQLPGFHETALLGSNISFVKEEAYAIFRTEDVLRYEGARRPFGMHGECGRLLGPNSITGPDLLGQDLTVFIDEYGPEGSVWQLERNLATGADMLAEDGLNIIGEGQVSGRESFAYLLGARISDLIFEQATGARLTIAHGFPRNLDQASRLEALTDDFVGSGFSLRKLLVDITADELFNPGLPSECEMQSYGLPPVANPWSPAEEDPEMRKNSPGDLVHRHTARVLLNSANDHLGWAPTRGWRLSESESEFQASIGVWLRESQPGFNGTDFQGLLALHDRYAACESPGPDWIDELIDASGGRSTREVVATLKDRLLANSAIATPEEPLLQALLGPLDDPASSLDSDALRAVCGAIVTSPSYMLVHSPLGIGEPVPINDRTAEECARAVADMEAAGFTGLSCDEQ